MLLLGSAQYRFGVKNPGKYTAQTLGQVRRRDTPCREINHKQLFCSVAPLLARHLQLVLGRKREGLALIS